jgi:uncharacterized phage protein (TIGR02220 family)
VRIRTVKPEFFTHEGIFEAERESGLPLRLAFIGLWCAADREGRFRWEPRRLGVQILPYDLVDFSRVLDALVTRGFVSKYAVADRLFGCIPSFTRHQVINNRESESSIPEPPSEPQETLMISRVPDACPTREAREENASKAEGNGKERGKEGNTEQGTGNGFELVVEPVGRGEVPESGPALEKRERKEAARRILEALNRASGRQYRPTETNLGFIAARLAEGDPVDEAGCLKMIERQCIRWKDSAMAEYLRPSTLFGKENFDSYFAARNEPVNMSEPRKIGRRETSTPSDKAF